MARYNSYSQDPKIMQSRFSSKCAKCGNTIAKDETIVYFPRTKSAMHSTCGDADYRASMSAIADEGVMWGTDNPYCG